MTVSATQLEANPLREGLDQERVPDASILVIFGASGDLTQRKLIPSLYSLAHDGLLPANQVIVGFARAGVTDDKFRADMREACDRHARRRPTEDAVWESFASKLFFIPGEFENNEDYVRLRGRLEELDEERGT
ncbi:MAG TPA: glucose-6-phosphate dehydrogenase, partial [Thermoanaerobaculia bacterium]|nr:glucose-6-phosphate dehydrogenase [Thermoanaerobaculia bacterium]